MDSKSKITISWSGGKDSALMLYKILQEGKYEVVHLHTIINEETRRVGMHGIHEGLMDDQAKAIGIPLVKLYLEASEDHTAYQTLMLSFYEQCHAEGITAVAFGDIFLEDLKYFRDKMLRSVSLQALFPLWQSDTRMLIRDFISAGFKTLLCAANAEYFTPAHLGTTIDNTFIDAFPESVDPCGENGEFHTFVYDGPIFKKPLLLDRGEVVRKEYTYQVIGVDGKRLPCTASFWFQDLFPATTS